MPDNDHGSKTLVRGIGIALALIGALVLLYFGGRWLIERNEEGGGDESETLQTLQECTDDTIYTTLDTALRNRESACYLDLSDQNLASLSGSIGHLRNMREFDVSGNELTAMPSQFSYMRGLEVMDLSNNNITEVPGQIGYLTELRRVDWSGNNLKTIPVQISYMRDLEVFDLSDNQLTEIPEHIGYFRNLQVLDLRNNALTSLPERMDNLVNLERLELGGNPLPPHEIERMKQALPNTEVRAVGSRGSGS